MPTKQNCEQQKLTSIPSILRRIVFMAILFAGSSGNAADNVLCYVGGAGNQRFNDIVQLSDGSVLIAGSATDLSWLPRQTKQIELKGPGPEGATTDVIPLLLHVSADLKTVRAAITLPKHASGGIDFIKTTNVPGQKTGALYVSGRFKKTGEHKRDGFYVARLDGNVVDALPSRIEWIRHVGYTGREQPWDVDSQGRVVFATGTPHGYDWMAIGRMNAKGKDDIVKHWRRHWYKTPEGKGGEWHGRPASKCPHPVTHSGIALKMWGRGGMRSDNKADFLMKTEDANGGVKQGRWPLDAMFDGYFDPTTKKTVRVLTDKKGYYGYRFGGTPCANVSVIAIDRRNNDLYIGGNNKSKLPDGNPDFEPWVVAMTADGNLRWWQRLYPESKGVSTPDQYIDAIAVDYNQAADKNGSLVVIARCHGNNVNNFYNPSKLTDPRAPKRGFQDGFTGTHGNMHFSWIGRLTCDKGRLIGCTYFAEYAEGAKHQDKPFSDPLLKDWPHWRAGWPDLNTTRTEPHLRFDGKGNVYVAALGRRVVTTANAHQQMPSPIRNRGSKGQWSDFVRVYSKDLSGLRYSSLVHGKWDWQTGSGGSSVDIRSIQPIPGGLLLVGYAKLNKEGKATGTDMPVANRLPWSHKGRTGEMAVIGRLHFKQ